MTPRAPAGEWRTDPVLQSRPRWRRELYRIIFEHDTPAGKTFDIVLIPAILVSVFVVMVESVAEIRARSGATLLAAEWVFTFLFTVEYVLRLASARNARRYATSFFGFIDLLAILPTYLSVLVPGGQGLAVIRILRVLRVFRVLKLAQFVGSEQLMIRALRASAAKIVIFVVAVLSIVVVVGAAMHLLEGPERGFTSIPRSVYWAIVTVTTVGFGTITPQTPVGQLLAAALMIMGYGIIAVPTGIVTAEMTAQRRGRVSTAPDPATIVERLASEVGCPECGRVGHDSDAVHCKYCGAFLSS